MTPEERQSLRRLAAAVRKPEYATQWVNVTLSTSLADSVDALLDALEAAERERDALRVRVGTIPPWEQHQEDRAKSAEQRVYYAEREATIIKTSIRDILRVHDLPPYERQALEKLL